MNNNSKVPLIVLAVVSLLICAICCLSLLAAALLFGLRATNRPVSTLRMDVRLPTSTPLALLPTRVPATTLAPTLPAQGDTPQPTNPRPTDAPATGLAPTDTLQTLEDTLVPVNDLIDLAQRLEGKQDIPLTVTPPATPYRVGDPKTFWATNVDNNQNFQVEATLRYATEHLYFWIEDGISYREADLRNLAETFENEIYPTNREFFGSEWTPGVDGDPHLYVLYATGLGRSVAGYFSSADQVHPLAHEYSNAHEMFMLNADTIGLDELFTYGVLAHEFQHMIHWYQDRNEETWLNEGFSELASFLNGYNVGFSDFLYVQDPDLQLTHWPEDGDTLPHYGASFLFVTYFLDRFGEQATQALVRQDENGMHSVDVVLANFGAIDGLTGQLIQADDVFQDWTLANYLKDARLADGRYTYENYPDSPQAQAVDNFRNCPLPAYTDEVHQYGVDYYRITCTGDFRLRFEGNTSVPVLPADPYSGSYAFWSNRGDESHMTLTQEFDFSDHSGPLSLSYWTWYDLEKDYDYLYLTASTGGDTWEILQTPSGTSDDPSGNSYGWAYNGASGLGPRWIEEEVDLTRFAGQQVTLSFEYVTDAAVNGEGLLLDDVAIPEIGYFTDFENDNGGWEAAGFARIQNILPQTFRLALITYGNTTAVQLIDLPPTNQVEIPLVIGADVREAVLVVSGVTRYTRQKAHYQIDILAGQ